MTPERYQQVEQLYQQVLQRPVGERAAFLETACAGDESLRREVESLLAAYEQAKSFLERPPEEVAAEMLAAEQARSMAGRRLAHYQIRSLLGTGGMGEVYLAEDSRLGRKVALKLLADYLTKDKERMRRFRQEARAASALNHSNVATIYEIGEADGTSYIAMEYVQGQTLNEKINARPLDSAEIIDIGIQIADALEEAHSKGITHRDIKPANIMITARDQVKVLDFGLAKVSRPEGQPAASDMATLAKTEPGVLIGTVRYMSPEQALGREMDHRTDLFSLGVVLYEMATGRPPFSGATATETIDRIIHAQPEAIVRINHNVPADLERIIRKCLEKDRERRYRCAAELLADLKSLKQELSSASMPAISVAQVLRKPQAVILAGLIVLALALATTWFFHRAAKARWAQREGLSELARLMQKEDYVAAFRVARQVERYVPDDPLLTKLRRDFLLPVSIHTSPPDADVYMKEYKDAQGNWEYLGHSPIEGIKLPFGYFRWRIAKKGFAMVDAATHGAYNPITFTLDPEGSLPPGMVRVPGGNFQLGSSPPVQLDDFLIDTYEVTNREFKKFVDAEGYRKREYWKEEFLRDGRRLTWEQAMAAFRDVTGRPGPSTWELGDYPRGQEEFPVSGVSWYEAAAYAEFAGKSLPTVYHWYKAAGAGIFSDILQFSNFRGKGPARVGSHQGIGPYGTYDMAGNVKEWCWNATGDHRYILGGGWNEPVYMFTDEDARSAFDRSATHGFRCMKYLGAGPISQALTGRIKRIARDYSKEKPVSDDIFRVYQSLYSYDRGALNPVIESVDMSSEYWTKQRITFNAAYGNDRIIAHLFTPKNVAPPYQTVVYFPHGGALQQRSFENMDVILLDFIIRSGRALFCPIYKGTYERQVNDRLGPNAERDLVIQWSKDLGRSLDYLESRADIDGKKLAFYGVSLGAQIGPVLLSLEKRLNVAVLWFGGLPLNRRLPEIDPINFAPRVRIPVLMLNGQYDFTFPVRTSQIPLFRLLGTPELDKRHVLYEGGHVLPRNQLIKETLDWLDRYLGPVK